ncbi:hypothetical protein PtA15_5A464 [Puccinia triticina]|uniref:Uncharacterized protein n=1 Tax=Puccinia triticina TaxID=208348 RepID=A0ABY7CI34_9BASI|nr:uncharacterized protein PtA15_5A464 [Puccinia triticina]WAQ84891.1 hypothetical protein PtA15_5A464 [Puccinia triticina]WAR58236.1 hypothetical protein PtB15_5B469 [Puccinia triticina]
MQRIERTVGDPNSRLTCECTELKKGGNEVYRDRRDPLHVLRDGEASNDELGRPAHPAEIEGRDEVARVSGGAERDDKGVGLVKQPDWSPNS